MHRRTKKTRVCKFSDDQLVSLFIKMEEKFALRAGRKNFSIFVYIYLCFQGHICDRKPSL